MKRDTCKMNRDHCYHIIHFCVTASEAVLRIHIPSTIYGIKLHRSLEVGILFDTEIEGRNSIYTCMYMYVIPQQLRGVVLGLL